MSFNVLGQASTFAIGFVSSIVIARVLGPADRGLLAIMVTVPAVTLSLVSLGLPTAILYFSSRRETSQNAVLGNNLAFGLLLGAVAVPAFWLLHGPIADVFSSGRGGELWVLASLLLPLTFLDWATTNQLIGGLRFGLFNLVLVFSKLASLVVAVVLLEVFHLGLRAALIAALTIPVLDVAITLAILLRRTRPRLDRGLFRRMVGYGGRAQLGVIFHAVNYRFDVLILQAFAPLRVVGYYVVAQILAELVIYLGLAFQTSVLPLVSHYDGDERQTQTTLSALRHHGALSIVAIAGNAIIAPLILLFAYGNGFRPALVPMFILLPSMWFLATGNVISGDLSGRGRPGLSSTLTGATAVLTVVLDLVLIPPFGVVGAATASAVAYIAFGVLSLRAQSRVTGVSVRDLIVPTRADLAMYPAAVRSLLHSRRGGRGPTAQAPSASV